MLISYENGKSFEHGDVKKINIYENGKILFTLEQGYISEYTTNKDGEYKENSYDGRIFELRLKKEIKRAIKINLNRKDNFYVKFTGKYSFESGKEIFINSNEISVSDDGEKLAFATKDEKNYLHAFTLKNESGFVMNRFHAERITDKNFKLPEGCSFSSCYGTKESPCYGTFKSVFTGKSGVVKRWKEAEIITELKTAQRYYTRCEKSEYRIKCENLANEINELKIFNNNISHYDIDKLLKNYNITRK